MCGVGALGLFAILCLSTFFFIWIKSMEINYTANEIDDDGLEIDSRIS